MPPKKGLQLGEWKDFKNDLIKLIEQDCVEVLTDAAEVAGTVLDGIVRRELPPKPRKIKASKWWTDRQKAWWWATMNAKARGQSNDLPGWKASFRVVDGVKILEISGSYRRTGQLVQRMTFDVQASASGVTLRYGTNVRYAKYVIDRENQARYHRGNWQTLQSLAEDNLERISDAFETRLMKNIRKRLT